MYSSLKSISPNPKSFKQKTTGSVVQRIDSATYPAAEPAPEQDSSDLRYFGVWDTHKVERCYRESEEHSVVAKLGIVHNFVAVVAG